MHKIQIAWLPFALILATAAHARGQSTEQVRLRSGDAVRLMVRDEPQLSGEFPVLESGQVMLPEIGFVTAVGRPFNDFQGEVLSGYKRVIVNVDVVVIPLLRIAVLGEVRKPGLFPVDPTQSLADVLASAGGLTTSANSRNIMIMRDGAAKRVALTTNAPSQLVQLRSGDQIIVGQRSWWRENVPILIGAFTSVVAAAATTLLIR
jgi:polysaccharide export outer membrane protein